MTPHQAFEAAVATTQAVIDHSPISDDDLRRSTPCRDFDVAHIVRHDLRGDRVRDVGEFGRWLERPPEATCQVPTVHVRLQCVERQPEARRQFVAAEIDRTVGAAGGPVFDRRRGDRAVTVGE